MTSNILKDVAKRAGVTEEQATALVKELSVFTAGMANAGDIAIPPFAWPDDLAPLLRESFAGWEGLTRGQFNGTRAAVIWRAICGYLLADGPEYGWEGESWPHPKVEGGQPH